MTYASSNPGCTWFPALPRAEWKSCKCLQRMSGTCSRSSYVGHQATVSGKVMGVFSAAAPNMVLASSSDPTGDTLYLPHRRTRHGLLVHKVWLIDVYSQVLSSVTCQAAHVPVAGGLVLHSLPLVPSSGSPRVLEHVNHLPSFPQTHQPGTRLKVEQPALKQAPLWNASIRGRGFTHCSAEVAPVLYL